MPHPFDLLVTVLIRPDLGCPVSMPRDIIPEAVMQREPAKLALTMRLAFWSAATRSAVAEHLSKVYEVESLEFIPPASPDDVAKTVTPPWKFHAEPRDRAETICTAVTGETDLWHCSCEECRALQRKAR